MKPEQKQDPRPNLLLYAVLAALAVYLVLFFASPYQWSAEHEVARGQYILPMVLLPDEEIVEAWLNSPADLLIFDRLLPLALALAIGAMAAMLGYLGLVAVGVDRRLSQLEQFFFAEAVGLNLLSTCTLAVGLLGGLHQPLWFILPGAVVVVASAWLMRRRGAAMQSVVSYSAESPRREIGWLSYHWLWVGGAFAALILLGGLLPPNEFDVREYHLQAPKEFYTAGRIEFLPHNVYGNLALGAEMHALLGMVLAGDWWTGALAGKTVIALFAPLTALGLFTAGRRFFSPAAGILAAIVYITIPLVANISTFGFIEGAAALYLFASLHALLIVQGDDKERRAHWLLPGYLAGASVATKYPGLLFVVVPLGAWLLWSSFRRRKEGRRSKISRLAPFVFGGAVLLGCGLWLAKNWALAGNPLYPMLYGLFGGRTLTAEKSELWNLVHSPAGFTLSALLSDVRRVLLSSDWLSPLLIPLAALAFFHRRRSLVLGLFAYYLFVIAAWWALALRIDRYWAPALPILALLSGAGATWCRDRVWQYALLVLLIVGSVFNFITAATPPCIYPPLFVPYQTLRTSPKRVNPWHLYLNEEAEGKVLMVGEAQVFDLETPVLYSTWLDDSIFESIVRDPATGRLRPAERICAELQSRNISHVYVAWSEIARYRATGYGQWEFIRPELFQQLVRQDVLQPVRPPDGLEESVNQVYRVDCKP